MSAVKNTTATPSLSIKVGAHSLPLREFVSAKGNTCYSIMAKNAKGERYMSKYGVQLPRLTKDLPSQVTLVVTTGSKVEQVALDLEQGMTQSEHAKVSIRETMDVPGLGRKMLVLSISETKAGNFNVIAKAIPTAEGGGGRVLSLDDL